MQRLAFLLYFTLTSDQAHSLPLNFFHSFFFFLPQLCCDLNFIFMRITWLSLIERCIGESPIPAQPERPPPPRPPSRPSQIQRVHSRLGERESAPEKSISAMLRYTGDKLISSKGNFGPKWKCGWFSAVKGFFSPFFLENPPFSISPLCS